MADEWVREQVAAVATFKEIQVAPKTEYVLRRSRIEADKWVCLIAGACLASPASRDPMCKEVVGCLVAGRDAPLAILIASELANVISNPWPGPGARNAAACDPEPQR